MSHLDNVIKDAAADSEKQKAEAAQKEAAKSVDKASMDAAIASAVNSATVLARSAAADILQIAIAASVPERAITLIREGASVEHARARIEEAKEISKAADAAETLYPTLRGSGLGKQLIAAGLTLDQAKAKLFDTTAAIEATKPQIRSVHQGQESAPGQSQAEITDLWSGAAKKVNAEKGKRAA